MLNTVLLFKRSALVISLTPIGFFERASNSKIAMVLSTAGTLLNFDLIRSNPVDGFYREQPTSM